MKFGQTLRPIFFQLKIELSGTNRVNSTEKFIETPLPSGIEVSPRPALPHRFRNIHDVNDAIVQPSAVGLVLDEGESDGQFIVKGTLEVEGDV